MIWPFGDLQPGSYGAILADPPWAFNLWWGGRSNKTPAGVPSRATAPHYNVMREDELAALPVGDLAADDCVLVIWICIKQAIIEPRREHSRKPDGIHERIERLVAGPYCELFARQSRPGWDTWGNEATKFDRSAA